MNWENISSWRFCELGLNLFLDTQGYMTPDDDITSGFVINFLPIFVVPHLYF